MKKKELIVTVSLVAAVVAIAAVLLALYYTVWKPKGNENEKTVTFEVYLGKDNEKNLNVTQSTNAGYLKEFMDELVSANKMKYVAEEQEIGIGDNKVTSWFLVSVNDYTADWNSRKEWFQILIDGESAPTGIGDTVLEDGKVYRIVLTIDTTVVE